MTELQVVEFCNIESIKNVKPLDSASLSELNIRMMTTFQLKTIQAIKKEKRRGFAPNLKK